MSQENKQTASEESQAQKPSTSETRAYTLKVPLKNTDDTMLTMLSFREPTVGDVIFAEENASGRQAQVFAVLASMCGTPMDVFNTVKVRDLEAIMSLCEDWLGNL